MISLTPLSNMLNKLFKRLGLLARDHLYFPFLPMMGKLPLELWDTILDHLSDSDLLNIYGVNRHFFFIYLKRTYEKVSVYDYNWSLTASEYFRHISYASMIKHCRPIGN
jgi:hypothetical protein